MKPWLKIMLCLVICSLTACAQDDRTHSEVQPVDKTYTLATLPKPTDHKFSLPKLSDVQGQLLSRS
jgi:hypothetical protein